eukprot:6194284-Pleurochrysis_carterae.AAC.2
MIPSSVVAARQQLVVLLRARVEDAGGLDRLPEVRDEVRALASGGGAGGGHKLAAGRQAAGGGRKPLLTKTRACASITLIPDSTREQHTVACRSHCPFVTAVTACRKPHKRAQT